MSCSPHLGGAARRPLSLVSARVVAHLGLAVTCLAIATAAHAQRTWVVDDDAGPGVDFLSIQPAVDAAAAGDRILIQAGFYAAPTIDKGVALFAGRNVDVATFTRPLTIRGIPAGEVVSLNGFARDG